MEYMIFPTQAISISQGYKTTHRAWDLNGDNTGISPVYAPCTMKIVNLLERWDEGFYNAVIFVTCDENGNPSPKRLEDGSEQILSISMTHLNTSHWESLGYYIGKIYKTGEICYYEGTEGLATGNHVHMCVGYGLQTNYSYYDSQYLLQNTLRADGSPLIAYTFYSLEGWNWLRNGNGYTFQSVSSRTTNTPTPEPEPEPEPEPPEPEPEPVYDYTLQTGLNIKIWEGYNFFIYKQNKSTEKLNLYNLESGNTQDVKAFKSDTSKCLIPCNFFKFNNPIGQKWTIGRSQGVPYQMTTDEPDVLDIVLTNEDVLKIGDFASWDYTDVKIGFSPYIVPLWAGERVGYYSQFDSSTKDYVFNSLNERNFMIILPTGEICLCNCSSNISANKLADYVELLGATSLIILDGGGSTQMLVNNEAVNYSGRDIPNVLVLEELGEEPEPPTPEPEPEPEPPEPEPEPEPEPPEPEPPTPEPEPEPPGYESEGIITIFSKALAIIISLIKKLLGQK